MQSAGKRFLTDACRRMRSTQTLFNAFQRRLITFNALKAQRVENTLQGEQYWAVL